MFLEIRNLNKTFGDHPVICDSDFSLPKRQTLSILGQSGCGKTTMLKIIAGLLSPDSGDIVLNGQKINDLHPSKRNIVYLYQEDLLFPHLNAFENVAFGLRLKKIPDDQIRDRVQQMFESLELEGQQQKKPHELSGGQRQRVSFGRAIITTPAVLLLDEPFGSLDTGTRNRMQALFKSLTKKFEITSVFVTHDLKEAVLMGDRIGFMEHGHLKIYPSKEEFIRDPLTGVQSEMDFWRGLESPQNTWVETANQPQKLT